LGNTTLGMIFDPTLGMIFDLLTKVSCSKLTRFDHLEVNCKI
jgi:hypothetical protein